MAIRDRVRRALRKSEASSDTLSQTESNGTTSTANTSQSSQGGSPKKSSSKLSRTWTFGSRDKSKEKRRMHPSEKPLTAQNLRHQEMLSGFTMTFGASDPDQIESASFIGISPCCTRAGSRRGSINLDSLTDDLSSLTTA